MDRVSNEETGDLQWKALFCSFNGYTYKFTQELLEGFESHH